MFVCFFYVYCDHRDLHVLTHSFPTRRSSDLRMTAPRRRAPFSTRCESALASSSSAFGISPILWASTVAVPSTTIPSRRRSEEHTSELQSLMRISYAVFCLKTKQNTTNQKPHYRQLQPVHSSAQISILQ